MAEAQNWEGEEEEPPEPTEAQRRATERAEEVRRTRKVCLQDIFLCIQRAILVPVTAGPARPHCIALANKMQTRSKVLITC